MKVLIIIGLFVLGSYGNTEIEDVENQRASKLLPVFQVVRFPNDPCVVTSGAKNGTCYTAEECSNKGGTNAGSCASGFGVCCTFSIGCGQSSSENCTYFESTSTVQTGACNAKICKCSSDICQIRMDFNSFVITGPSTVSVSVGLGHGLEIVKVGKKLADATQCNTDTFGVTNQNTFSPICGTNTGFHVYFEASDQCNDLTFQLGNVALGVTSVATRAWSIKISQYSCNSDNLAPEGCDQWFFGSAATNYIKSYNYDGGKHLANQRQTICIRRETGNCQICYTAPANDVYVSGTAKTADKAAADNKGTLCCGLGTKGDATAAGYDCIMIPGASKADDGTPVGQSICGAGVGLVTAPVASAVHATSRPNAKTICSKVFPFRIHFNSDAYENVEANDAATAEGATSMKGFKIQYFQKTC